MQNVRGKSILIIKIIMPRLCIKARKSLSLWCASAIRVRLAIRLAFSNKSSTESQPSRKLFRAVVQLGAHAEEDVKNESTLTNNPLPGISSIASEDSQNDKLQSEPSRDGHAIENEVEPIPPRSELPLKFLFGCTNRCHRGS